jgi:hypothetical protein
VNDIHDLLARAATESPLPPSVIDADLGRGRRALRLRRARRVAGPLAIASVGAAAITTAALNKPQPSGPLHAVVQSPLPSHLRTTGPTPPAEAIRLVAYTGGQPSGYRVAYVPAGWEIQGADPFAMTLAPQGFADQQPASFVGKLVVMLRSRDDTGTPGGTPVPVGGRTGYLNHTEGIVVLTYQDSAAHWIQLQVPPTLHWSDSDVTKFGAGVEITGDAVPGRG